MQVEWYGQSAFRLSDGKDTIFIDPFDVAFFAGRRRWDYPAIVGVDARQRRRPRRRRGARGAVAPQPRGRSATTGMTRSPARSW